MSFSSGLLKSMVAAKAFFPSVSLTAANTTWKTKDSSSNFTSDLVGLMFTSTVCGSTSR